MAQEPSPRDAREAIRLFQLAILVLPTLALALVLGRDSTVRDGIFIALLVGTLPILSLAQLPFLTRERVERLSAYVGSIITLLVLGSAGLILGALGPGLEAMGLEPALSLSSLQTAGILTAGIVALGLAFWLAGEVWNLDETAILRELIPRNARERSLFVLLSLAAGVGEEVAYRGYLVTVLGALFEGPWVAAAVSSLAFSLLHAYQGPLGILRSGLMGFLFAAAFILHGSLWPLIVVHVVVDLFSGFVLGPRMLLKEDPAS
ncbi:MAG TPA: type II CAAX endopeptidase family protein [Longimicrobiales bacterium]|nr:type II CAAX endopeptidase family protein [Longimicrobiales bacterium]